MYNIMYNGDNESEKEEKDMIFDGVDEEVEKQKKKGKLSQKYGHIFDGVDEEVEELKKRGSISKDRDDERDER